MNNKITYTPSQLNELNDLCHTLEKLGIIDYSLYLSSTTRLWLKYTAAHQYFSSSFWNTTDTNITTITTTNTGNK